MPGLGQGGLLLEEVACRLERIAVAVECRLHLEVETRQACEDTVVIAEKAFN